MSSRKAMTTTIRVTQKAYNTLKDVAEQEHASIQDTLEKLLEEYATRKFFADLSQAVAQAKERPGVWEEELVEREEWEVTLSDGLEKEEEDADEVR